MYRFFCTQEVMRQDEKAEQKRLGIVYLLADAFKEYRLWAFVPALPVSAAAPGRKHSRGKLECDVRSGFICSIDGQPVVCWPHTTLHFLFCLFLEPVSAPGLIVPRIPCRVDLRPHTHTHTHNHQEAPQRRVSPLFFLLVIGKIYTFSIQKSTTAMWSSHRLNNLQKQGKCS